MIIKREYGSRGASFWIGLVFLVLGGLWTLDNLGFVDSEPILRWWPAVLVVIGVNRLFGIVGPRRAVWGTMVLGAGSVLLLNSFDVTDIGVRELWALGLLFIGAMIVHRSMAGGQTMNRSVDASDRINVVAVMGAVERKVQSASFRGGEGSAVMGALELDFGATRLAGDEASLDLTVVMGGVDILVPRDWQVVQEVMPVMGAVEDNRKAPPAEAKQRLRLTGFVMMGGVEIKDAKEMG